MNKKDESDFFIDAMVTTMLDMICEELYNNYDKYNWKVDYEKQHYFATFKNSMITVSFKDGEFAPVYLYNKYGSRFFIEYNKKLCDKIHRIVSTIDLKEVLEELRNYNE